jgi:hypothetical protein
MSGPGASAPNRELVELALKVLPDLRTARDRLAEDPGDTLRRLPGGPEPGPGPPDEVPAVIANGVAAIETLEAEGADVVLGPESVEGLEAVVFQFARPALFMRDGGYGAAPPPWDRVLEPHRASIAALAARVGRVEFVGLPQFPYAGTGFLVGEDVVMTNCHVASLFAQADDQGRWAFRPGFSASLSTADDPRPLHFADPLPGFDVTELIGVHERLDLALLRVEPAAGADALPEPLTVAAQDPGPLDGRRLFVIGYPMFDALAKPELQELIFGRPFDVKRLQPGEAMATPPGATPVRTPCSNAGNEDAMFHDASTLRGNSGSAVFDLEQGKVIGLHFSGAQWRFNRAVALWKLVDDPLLARAGVHFG